MNVDIVKQGIVIYIYTLDSYIFMLIYKTNNNKQYLCLLGVYKLKGVLFILIKAKVMGLAIRRTKKADRSEQQVELGLSQAKTG